MNTKLVHTKEYKMINKDFKETLNSLPIYIMTADEHMQCLPAFCYLFNKFWSDEMIINIIGYSKPDFKLPKNVNYISMGKDRGAEYWSDDMIAYFSSINDELFYLNTEDSFILKKINENLLYDSIKLSRNLILNNPNFLRFNLTHCVSTRSHSFVEKSESGGEIILASKNTYYRHSLQHSLWNRKNFLNILKPNMTPWDLELDESAQTSIYDIYAFRGTCPLNIGHVYSKGKKIPNWYHDIWSHLSGFGDLNQEDIKYIENNGWVPEIKVSVQRDSGGKRIY